MALKFKSPVPKHTYSYAAERTAVTKHFTKRQVPKSTSGRLLLATWNIANLGVQGRTLNAKKLIAHILKRFDLVAIQEVKDELGSFHTVLKHLGPAFDYFITDPAGNTERMAFVYRKSRVKPANLFGEVALRELEYPKRTVNVRWTDATGTPRVDKFKSLRFVPFDRNPAIGSFKSGNFDFVLANCHLYFGKFQNSKKKDERARYARRVLEIYALSRWANRRVDSSKTYDKDIIMLGDMNVPAMEPEEATYKALVKFGWQPVKYVTKTAGSNLGNDKTYDQMVFAPGGVKNRVVDEGVFDFDKAIFKPLWTKLDNQMSKGKAVSKFNAHVKHHISDHRPLWVQLDVT
ncbi:MAG: endonuclease/exonuclease/phosphatase family protein [bacterium]|nr:endonuclease/exonuclease/phosphatase family protein [bacterium]